MADEMLKDIVRNFVIYLMLGILMIIIILATIGGFMGNIKYEYELSKCRNLNSKSYYDFSHDIQMGAVYSQDCYYIENHPLARLSSISGRSFLTVIMGGMVILLTLLIKALFKKPGEVGFIDDW